MNILIVAIDSQTQQQVKQAIIRYCEQVNMPPIAITGHDALRCAKKAFKEFKKDLSIKAVEEFRETIEELRPHAAVKHPLDYESHPRWAEMRFLGGVIGWGYHRWTNEIGLNLQYWKPVIQLHRRSQIHRRCQGRSGCPPMNRGRHFDRKLR